MSGSVSHGMEHSRHVHAAGATGATTVGLRATGHVRDALGTPQVPSAFEAPTLRAFVAASFNRDDVREPVMAEPEAEPATCGRVPVDGDDLPDELARSPDGERTCRASAS